jgi:hypothetical protein
MNIGTGRGRRKCPNYRQNAKIALSSTSVSSKLIFCIRLSIMAKK